MENALLGRKFTLKQAVLRLSLFSSVLAMFTSSTLAAALLLGSANRLAKRNTLPSEILISAMRTAASIGGFSTVMGVSNAAVVVVGLAKQYLCLTVTGFDLFKIGFVFRLL